MAHFRCSRCSSRVWRDGPAADHADALCPGCGDPLVPVSELSELVGLRLLRQGSREERALLSDRSARIAREIRDTIARHDADRRRDDERR